MDKKGSRPPRPPAPKKSAKSSLSGLQIHFSPGSDSDEGSAELVTSIKTLIKAKASSLDSAYNEISDLLRSDTSTLPHKKSSKKDKHSPPRKQVGKKAFDTVFKGSDPLSDETEFGATFVDSKIDAYSPVNSPPIPTLSDDTHRVTDQPLHGNQRKKSCPDKTDVSSEGNLSPVEPDLPAIQNSNVTIEPASYDEQNICESEFLDPLGGASPEPSPPGNYVPSTTSNSFKKDVFTKQDAGISDLEGSVITTNESDKGHGELLSSSCEDEGRGYQQISNDSSGRHLINERKSSATSLTENNLFDCDKDELFKSNVKADKPSHENCCGDKELGIVRSWDDGSVDPLTALSLEADDEDYYPPVITRSRASSERETSGEFDSSVKLDKPSSIKPVVTKSESLPTFPNSSEPVILDQRADSFDMVDDFYDVVPVEEFDGTINTPYMSQSLPNSPTHVQYEKSGIKQVLKRKLTKTPTPKINIKPLQFSSLAKSAAKQEELHDKVPSKASQEKLDDFTLKKRLLNINQSSNRSLVETEYPTPVPWQKILCITMCVFSYLILPLPSFISGLIFGCVVTYVAMQFYLWITETPEPIPRVLLENIASLPPLEVPEMKESHLPTEDNEIYYEGWMNELTRDYDYESYHVSETVSVFLTLQGTMLRLRRPKTNVPKHHVWYEASQMPPFIHQRHYDLAGSSVFLRPEGLVKKRVWSKKYPICIILKQPGYSPEHLKSSKTFSLLEMRLKVNRNANDRGLRTSRELTETEVAKVKEDSTRLVRVEENSSLGCKDNEREARNSTTLKSEYEKAGKTPGGYVMVNKDKCDETLFLFARSCREKEEWFYRLKAASKSQPLVQTLSDIIENISKPLERVSSTSLPTTKKESEKHGHSRQGSNSSLSHKRQGSNESVGSLGQEMSFLLVTPQQLLEEYVTYMGHVMPANVKKAFSKVSLGPQRNITCDPQVMWVNALIGRGFFDFLRIGHWKSKVKEKIQKKLSKIHVPYFIDQLTMTDIDLGGELPTIRRASKPFLDDRGLWIDLDIAYGGGFRMTLETKVNLMKLKKSAKDKSPTEHSHPNFPYPTDTSNARRLAVTQSDEEDSAESSSDDEGRDMPPDSDSVVSTSVSKTARGAGKKFLRFIDTITETKFFQNATENKYVKRAMESVSNTQLVLHVEVVNLNGVLAINIPPPPTDRLWYGFRTNPILTLSAKPRVGEREVSMTRVTEWIEKKLSAEFQKIWVIPNMDDIFIPFMKASNHEEQDE